MTDEERRLEPPDGFYPDEEIEAYCSEIDERRYLWALAVIADQECACEEDFTPASNDAWQDAWLEIETITDDIRAYDYRISRDDIVEYFKWRYEQIRNAT
jgi:hypothetical protein